MDTNPEIVAAILFELRTIRWLLVGLAGLGVLMLLFVIGFTRAISAASKVAQIQQEAVTKQTEIENLLSSGQPLAAKFAAIEWLAHQPKNPQAHWLLAKAHHDLGEIVEAKKVFVALTAIASDWEFLIRPWLDRIDGEIDSSGPRIVK
jgi:hypothetical protein